MKTFFVTWEKPGYCSGPMGGVAFPDSETWLADASSLEAAKRVLRRKAPKTGKIYERVMDAEVLRFSA